MLKIVKQGGKMAELQEMKTNQIALVFTWILENEEDHRKAEKLLINFITRDNCKFGMKIIDTCDASIINDIDDDYDNKMAD